MSKEFRGGDRCIAAVWDDNGHMNVKPTIGVNDIPAFIAWLQEGPPKKRYRITKTFDKRPGVVSYFTESTDYHNTLTDSDIEEVWE
jgi:hypothetical protein